MSVEVGVDGEARPLAYWSYAETFDTHTTAEEARAVAEERLEFCRDESGDGWNTDIVEHIAWGPIAEHVVMTDRKEHHPECGRTDTGDPDECHDACDIPGLPFDFSCGYELRAVRNDGVSLIAAERLRQVNGEDWTQAHDDEHTDGSLVEAAVAYARYGDATRFNREANPHYGPPACWPWDASWWKPANRIRSLVKAGALIAAEIDRLIRLEES